MQDKTLRRAVTVVLMIVIVYMALEALFGPYAAAGFLLYATFRVIGIAVRVLFR